MHQDLIQEWFSHPVTLQFFKNISKTITECQEKSRYTPVSSGMALSADVCAMFNSYTEGQIDGLKECENIKEEMKNES